MSDVVFNVADFFKILSNPTRLRILAILYRGPCSVNTINRLIGSNLSLSSISTQLNLMKRMKLVSFKREGRTKIYSLHDHHVAHILNDAVIHITCGDVCHEIASCEHEDYHYIEEFLT